MRRALAALLLLAPLVGCTSSGAKAKTPPPDRTHDEDPLYWSTLLRQGSALLQQRRFSEALARFEEARRLAPTNPTVHNMIGICHMQMSEFDQAVSAFDEALELAPSFTDPRNNRGSAYLALGKNSLAEIDFLGVIADTTYAHLWEAYYNLGMAQLQQGRLAAAEECFRRAAYSPNPVFPAYLRLAEIAERQGRPEAALGILEEARLKHPDRIEVALELGRLLTRMGRVDEARPHLESVISADPSSALADQARALLAGR
jgi:tetratricopeptide (TPR) repeat protein